MISFIIKKLELLILTLFILTIILFWVHVRITGTETDSIIPEYWNYAVRLITLNFGNSSVSGMPIVDEIKIFFPPTIELLLLSLISALVVGVPLGIFGGLNHHSGSDKCIYTFCLLSTSIPVYWSSQILILFFCVYIKALPTTGNISLLYDVPKMTGFPTVDALLTGDRNIIIDMLQHMALPLFTLSVIPCATFARIARKSTIILTQKYFIKAAYCRGESKMSIGIHHVMRSILPEIIQQLNIIICNLYSSCILVEVIFEWPGTGLWITQSINNSDSNIIEATTFILGGIFLIINITLDTASTLFINRNLLSHS